MNFRSISNLKSHARIECLIGKCILIIGLLTIAFFSITPGLPSPSTTIGAEYTVYIPWTATTGGWTTPFVIANKGSSLANVTINYYNASDGSYVGNRSLNIEPNSSKPVFREWTNSTTDGSAIIVSNQSITTMVAMFNYNISGAYEEGASDPSDTSLSQRVYLPWTANARGWNTPFVIMNRGNVNATVNLTYYNVDGTFSGNDSAIIPPNASRFMRRNASCVDCEGPAVITSSQPISVMVEIFRGSEKSDRFDSYTPMPTTNRIFVPWTATTQGWRTQMNIVNSGNATATVNISYYDTASDMIAGYDSVNIAPNGTATVFRDRTSANGTDGSAVLSSDQPISVVIMQFSNNDSLFGSYTPAVRASNNLVIPWTATTQGWTTPYVIANTGSTVASVHIGYYNTEDGSRVGDTSLTIPPNSSKFAFREWNISVNTDGSAVVSSDQPVTAVVYGINTISDLLADYTPLE